MCVCISTGIYISSTVRCIALDVKLWVCVLCKCVFMKYFSIAGSDERRHDLQPFSVLDKASVNLQGKSVMKLAAPSLLNDYCKRR